MPTLSDLGSPSCPLPSQLLEGRAGKRCRDCALLGGIVWPGKTRLLWAALAGP